MKLTMCCLTICATSAFLPPTLAEDLVGGRFQGAFWAIESTNGAGRNIGSFFGGSFAVEGATAGLVYASTQSGLSSFDLQTSTETQIGSMTPTDGIIHSLAYDEGTGILYGFSQSTMYSINTSTSDPTAIGPLQAGTINGATIVPSGTLYVLTYDSSTFSTMLWEVDKSTAATSFITSASGTFDSLTSDSAGQLYVGSDSFAYRDFLHTLDLQGNITPYVEFQPPRVFRSLDFVDVPSLFEIYCNGDASGAFGCAICPCANSPAPGSVSGCVNSSGKGASLIPKGSPEVAQDSLGFNILGGNAQSFAILQSATNRLPATGPCSPGSGINSPVLDGLRCVGGAATRHGTRSIDTEGRVGYANFGWGPFGTSPGNFIASNGFVSGQTRHFQAFVREDPTLGCLTGYNTTNAVAVTFE